MLSAFRLSADCLTDCSGKGLKEVVHARLLQAAQRGIVYVHLYHCFKSCFEMQRYEKISGVREKSLKKYTSIIKISVYLK